MSQKKKEQTSRRQMLHNQWQYPAVLHVVVIRANKVAHPVKNCRHLEKILAQGFVHCRDTASFLLFVCSFWWMMLSAKPFGVDVWLVICDWGFGFAPESLLYVSFFISLIHCIQCYQIMFDETWVDTIAVSLLVDIFVEFDRIRTKSK